MSHQKETLVNPYDKAKNGAWKVIEVYREERKQQAKVQGAVSLFKTTLILILFYLRNKGQCIVLDLQHFRKFWLIFLAR